jgi:hypothetical protein
VTISTVGRLTRRGIGVCTSALVAWQPEHELAPGGASAATALAGPARDTSKGNPAISGTGTRFPPVPAAERRQTRQVDFRSWFINGSERMRLPVAAKIALSTAGAATAIVGSPTPPQKSPVGMMTTSTFGISSIRITL